MKDTIKGYKAENLQEATIEGRVAARQARRPAYIARQGKGYVITTKALDCFIGEVLPDGVINWE